MEPLLALLENPLPGVEVGYHRYTSCEYCLTSRKYKIFPKKIKAEDGIATITRSLKCRTIVIRTTNESDYTTYRDTIKAYLATTSDHIKFNHWGPTTETIKTVKPEFAADVERVNSKASHHQSLVDQAEKDFQARMSELGAEAWIEYGIKVFNWPENCRYDENWYVVTQRPNYSKCQIEIVFHTETELYKELTRRDFKEYVYKSCCGVILDAMLDASNPHQP